MEKSRHSHILKAGKRSVVPERVIFLDTETKPVPLENETVVQEFIIGVAQYRDYTGHSSSDEIVFTDIDVFWDWVDSKVQEKRKLYIIAHNTDFDFRVLRGFSHLHKRGYILKNIIADGGKWISDHSKEEDSKDRLPISGRRRRTNNKGSITVLDSLNWFKGSIKSLGKNINLPKLDFPSYTDSMDCWITYCRRDVDILRLTFERFVEFIKQHDMGNFGMTLAKQSINAFRHRFMSHEILIHTNERVIAIERQSYYGGRTEAFFIGHKSGEPFYKLDVNSQYPYVMREYSYPTKLIGLRYIYDDLRIDSVNPNETFIVDCNVDTPINCIPLRMNAKLCFPVGKFRATLCEPEYRLAIEMGARVKINKVVFYQCKPIFRTWVDEMYDLRNTFKEQGNDQYQYFVKILMNSLYGKFGQRTEEWEQIDTCDVNENWFKTIVDFETGKKDTQKAVGGVIFRKIGLTEGYDSQVAIAAFVCSYARTYLFRLMYNAGLSNVFYVDTDSLIVNSTGMDRLRSSLSNTELGKLKVESQDTELLIHNLKDYIFAGEIKIKGVRKDATKIGDNIFLCEQWEHLSGAIHKGRPESVCIKSTKKVLKRIYGKGDVHPDGSIQPFVIDELTLSSVKNT